MAGIARDRVRESSTTEGTGPFTLAGAVAGFVSFASVFQTSVDPLYYAIVGGAEWEVGQGRLTDSTTLERTTVLASSNAGAAVDFAAGDKDVFCTAPGLAVPLTARVTVDFGTARPAARSKTFDVTVRGAQTGMAVVASAALDMPAGVSADELEMDPITVAGRVTAANTVRLLVSSARGPLARQRNINVMLATAAAPFRCAG